MSYINQTEVVMKRICAFVITASFVLGLAVSPVFAEGGKVRGDDGVGPVEQEQIYCGLFPDAPSCQSESGEPYWW
jgi:hypothetical protein